MSQWLSDAKSTNVLVNLDHVIAVERRAIPGPKGTAAKTFSLVATMIGGHEIVIESGMTADTIGRKVRGIRVMLEGSMEPLIDALQERADLEIEVPEVSEIAA